MRLCEWITTLLSHCKEFSNTMEVYGFENLKLRRVVFVVSACWTLEMGGRHRLPRGIGCPRGIQLLGMHHHNMSIALHCFAPPFTRTNVSPERHPARSQQEFASSARRESKNHRSQTLSPATNKQSKGIHEGIRQRRRSQAVKRERPKSTRSRHWEYTDLGALRGDSVMVEDSSIKIDQISTTGALFDGAEVAPRRIGSSASNQ